MITSLLILFAAPVWILTLFFAVETLAGLRSERIEVSTRSRAPAAVVVVPACNESSVIARTVEGLLAALGKNMRLLVVADNCSDDTAPRARNAGAMVVERKNPNNRGKGFALAFGLESVRANPPSVAVVVDADCAIDKSSLRALVDAAADSNRPCQAVNLLRAEPAGSPLVQISTFAFMLKNLVRQRGLQRLAGRVHLTGTGMAIPFGLLSQSAIASDDIVEDLALGLEMARSGFPPKLVSEALVVSSAASASDTLVQRRRWEGGFLATSFRRGPKMLADGLRSGDHRLFLAGMDLLVPPLTLLVLANLAALSLITAVIALLGLSWFPFWFCASIFAFAACSILLVWAREGRNYIPARGLLRVPLYLIWKIPLYLSLGRRGAPREWLRTRR